MIAQLGLRDLTVQDWEGCVLSDAVVFAGVSKHNGIVGFDPDMIGWELPYRDELLFLANGKKPVTHCVETGLPPDSAHQPFSI